MPSFRNDYSYLCHPRILEALNRFNDENHIAYGLDKHSMNASNMIKKVFNAPDAEVFFLAGGTQTNMTFISYCLRPYEGVIACDTGHINVHETAAVEGSGHKIIIVKNSDGKLTPNDIEQVMSQFADEHMVKPAMIYISNSTEIGSIYHKQELIDLYQAAKKNELYLFIDGARLGSALTCNDNDVDSSLLGQACDAFYVGGTKNGLLFGEALVINNKDLQKDFRYQIKNRGAMLAKGYAVGIQFEEAFKDNLYFDLAKHTNEMAEELRRVLKKYFLKVNDSPTNQVFVTASKYNANKLLEEFSLEKWSEEGDEMTVRFVTSFKTTIEDIKEVDKFLANLLN